LYLHSMTRTCKLHFQNISVSNVITTVMLMKEYLWHIHIWYLKLRYVIWYKIIAYILTFDMDILKEIVIIIDIISYLQQSTKSIVIIFLSKYSQVSHDLGLSFWFAMDSPNICEPSIQWFTTFMSNNEMSCQKVHKQAMFLIDKDEIFQGVHKIWI